ncbi:TetR/AcrR family transcriptional regulator [Leifsonia sp. AG29]|uniref:TetR/AcrR family transcriptional regulator n=1 Tax=Leifsonia sp. AG29 TaxID=2598860 RepID=UPI00131B1BD3|nr:TetR/AcrR family transcriptional regulator [Leifsonia sp. AG29]
MSSNTAQMKSESRKRGQRHGDLPDALRAAALALIDEKGARGFTMSEVARASGVSVSAPYNHFEDKNALLADLATRAFGLMTETFTAEARRVRPEQRLAAVARAYVTFALTHRAEFDALFGTSYAKGQYPALVEAGAQLTGVLADASATALGRAVDDEAIDLAVEVMALAHGYAVFLLRGNLGDPDEELPRVLERVTRATDILVSVAAAEQ